MHEHETTYDCPDCGYHRTGVTTSPQDFHRHLTDEHDYTTAEARRIRQGRPYEYGIESYAVGELP